MYQQRWIFFMGVNYRITVIAFNIEIEVNLDLLYSDQKLG